MVANIGSVLDRGYFCNENEYYVAAEPPYLIQLNSDQQMPVLKQPTIK